MLGTSLLVLMNVGSGCKRNDRVTCYEISVVPVDTIETTVQQDSLEVMCYAAIADPVDNTPEISLPEVLPEKLVPANREVIEETGTANATDMDVNDDIICNDIS